MDSFPPPSNPLSRGEQPPHFPGEGEEDFEKKPVLKKVKDKVKKIKSTITNKARRHGSGNGGDDGNHHQQGDLDEEDEGYEEDEEMVEDPSSHGAPVYESSTAEAGTGGKGIWRVGENEGAHGNSTAGVSEMGTRGGAVGGYENSTARSGTGVNEGGGETEGKDIGLKAITPEFVEDPAAPNASARTKNKMEVDISPELRHSLDDMVTSQEHSSGKPELSEDKNLSNTTAIPSIGTDANEGAISPELHRSFDAMSVSDQSGKGEPQAPQNKSSSYTDKISTAKDTAVSVASMVYGKASEVGTAVMAKVKPETGKGESNPEEKPHFSKPEEEDSSDVVEKQDKGVSMKDYVSGKLSPGEEDKALSEVITEALTLGKNNETEISSPTSFPQKTSSGEGGGGMGVVGKIKETVSSFLGGGGSPRGLPSAEPHPKDEKTDFLGKTPEALSEEKTVE